MHEWALAEAAVSTILEVAEREELKRVLRVRIEIGELQQIDREIFDFALSQIRPPSLEETDFQIDEVPAKLQCRVCSYKWDYSSKSLDENISESIHFVPEIAHAFLKCPNCGSSDFEVVKGRGIWLQSIKGGK